IEVMKDIIRIIRQSTHQSQFIHVVEPLGFFVNEVEDKAYLVMELCSGGDLRGQMAQGLEGMFVFGYYYYIGFV
ncbi:MAG: hypothetical protein EZS28_031806, partial [Streblomastix strix]